MRQTAINFWSDDLSLEGVLATPGDPMKRYPAVAVCHPHSMLGGDMDNPIVTAVCRELASVGFASLRFNFRGVGRSEGEFTNGDGEQTDVESALETLTHWPGIDGSRLGVAGYSFGATVMLRAIKRLSRARSLVLIAPPVSAAQTKDVVNDERPMLFVTGEHDRIAPPGDLQRALDEFGDNVRFFMAPGVDHSMRGAEAYLAKQVAEFVTESV